jgi:hypothetical protein
VFWVPVSRSQSVLHGQGRVRAEVATFIRERMKARTGREELRVGCPSSSSFRACLSFPFDQLSQICLPPN